MPPPSSVLKNEFWKLKAYPPTEQYIETTAAKVLLTPDVTRMWMDHLHTVLLNRKRGAKKAVATRQAKKLARVAESQPTAATSDNATETTFKSATATSSEYHCGQCARQYQEAAEEEELWIGCDMCDKWYCGSCEGLRSHPLTDVYICTKSCQ